MDRNGNGDGNDDGNGAGTPTFAAAVYPLLLDGCASCHSSSGQAASSDLVLSAVAGADHGMVLRFVNLDQPGASRLLSKAAGLGHAGGAIYRPDAMEYQIILRWITGGASP